MSQATLLFLSHFLRSSLCNRKSVIIFSCSFQLMSNKKYFQRIQPVNYLLFVPIALFQCHRLPTFCHHPRLFSSLAGLIILQNFSSVRFQNSFLLPNFYQNFLPFSSSPDSGQDAMSGSISSISSSLIRSSRPIRGQYPGYVIILDQ